MFSDELEKISWEETTKAIYAKTEADVIRALWKITVRRRRLHGSHLAGCRKVP